MADPQTDYEQERHPEEVLLLRVANSMPDGFRPAGFAQLAGVDLDFVLTVLDQLHEQGLVQRIPPNPENTDSQLLIGLTQAGADLVNNPDALALWVEGRIRALELMHDLGRIAQPAEFQWATRGLLLLIAIDFGIGAILALNAGMISAFLFNPNEPGLLPIYKSIGLFVPDDPHAWWGLISAGFVHLGLIHLLVNSYSLNSLGKLSEALWGPVGFILIFIASVWSGFALMAAVSPGAGGGASGGICGLLGAMGAWLIINRNHLPADVRRGWTRALVINGILIGAMSLIPGISAMGHLGGALGGAMVGWALALMARGGNSRPMGASILLGAVVAMGLLGQYGMEHASASGWADAGEIPRLNQHLVPEMAKWLRTFHQGEENHWQPLLMRDKYRRNEVASGEAATLADASRSTSGPLLVEWTETTVKGKVTQQARTLAMALLKTSNDYLEVVAEALRAGRDWPMERDREIIEKRSVRRRAEKAWRDLLESNRDQPDTGDVEP